MTSHHRVLGGHLCFLQLLRSSFKTKQNMDSDAVCVYPKVVGIFIFYCSLKKSLRAFACVCECVCHSYLSGFVYWRVSQVNDEVIYPMFPWGNTKRNYPLRLGSPSLLFPSLLALYCSMESRLKKIENTQEKNSVSCHCTTETLMLHCFSYTHS